MYYTVDLKFKFFPIFLYRAILLKEINIVKKLQQPSNLLVRALSGIFLFKQENRIYQYFFFWQHLYISVLVHVIKYQEQRMFFKLTKEFLITGTIRQK